MEKIIYKAESRGHANHGWLDTHHTFSFASYYNPDRIHFGALRVLNDDKITSGTGFPKHPHDNMEIISIPLNGDLAHEDSMGTQSTIKQGDVQVMSAGTGVTHSEFNPNNDIGTEFLQIWVFPNKKNVEPRYGQVSYPMEERKNNFQMVVSPNVEEVDTWIQQDAWFHLADFEEGFEKKYEMKKKGNGLFLFLLEGEVEIEDEKLKKRDGIGLINLEEVTIKANADAEMLLMEVPLEW
ncbi:pirin family protein [Marivirga harenae]|uniref:pirin family protein n=1 Tax=Marivirga harenae TaxID=2010992 RepID=UPI0026DFB821|nr:pirin family protein [Marivirga harenae]WKV13335.1 pirin family protein [Marivirga harenae]|tara:strand:+ start:154670 stop:155383 length:714 start_codon:yes stop_codon:yes gene_type:complete